MINDEWIWCSDIRRTDLFRSPVQPALKLWNHLGADTEKKKFNLNFEWGSWLPNVKKYNIYFTMGNSLIQDYLLKLQQFHCIAGLKFSKYLVNKFCELLQYHGGNHFARWFRITLTQLQLRSAAKCAEWSPWEKRTWVSSWLTKNHPISRSIKMPFWEVISKWLLWSHDQPVKQIFRSWWLGLGWEWGLGSGIVMGWQLMLRSGLWF